MKKLLTAIFLTLLLALCLFALAEGDGFVLAAENEYLRLEFNETTFEMRVIELSDGTVHETKAMNGTKGNKLYKNIQKSDCRVTFIVNEYVGAYNSMDSNSSSVTTGNFEWERIKNGVSVRFTLCDFTKLTYDDLPEMVPVEKYNARLLPYWSEEDDKTFREFYRPFQGTMWVRTNENAMGQLKLQRLYEMFFVKAEYTAEDMAEDNAAYNYTPSKVNPRVYITMNYVLDGPDFVVSLPCDEIDFTEGNPVTKIDILPYFLSAAETTGEEGYLFVPDGCGSIIKLNNGKATALSYDDKVYGHDVLMNVQSYVAPYEPIRLPVYGIKYGDRATLAIIESGAALANIYAEISGRTDEFNRVYSYFVLRDIEQVAVVGNASGGSPRYPTDVYEGDIVIRYKFLSDGDANYVGMAHAYRDYLIGRGVLKEAEAPEEAPFFAEIIGAVRRTDFFAGIPYESRAVATTLTQAGTILDALTENGVKSPILLLRGFWDGGVKHKSLASISLEGSTGKNDDLTRLTQKAESLGGGAYLVTNVEKVYSTANFNKSSQASRRQDDYVAEIVLYAEPILSRAKGYTDSFYVSPAYIGEYSKKISQNLDKAKFSYSGLAVDDAGQLLVGDYRNKANISRAHALPKITSALKTLAKGDTLLLAAPNDYALKFATTVYDLPDNDNGHKVEDESVPFLQLVLDGSCVYTGKAWNESAYMGIWRELNFAVESKSCPHFVFSYEDEEIFLHTEDTDSESYFMTQYEQWLDLISVAYARYDAFWQLVKDARIEKHEIPQYGLRRVTYDNGVVVYINYNSGIRTQDGIEVPARDFVILEGGL